MIGLYSTRFIKSSNDFCLAGRHLPFFLCSSTMFSTWFGAETIVGASAEFLQHGFLGVIEDPFGTSLCFILIGIFIAKPIYKLDITTIVDLFKIKYGVTVEKISALFMILSYVGWIAAQLLAMAIIIKIIFHLNITQGVIISSTIVCIYTMSGGMWSVSINDFIQTSVIFIGLIAIGVYLYFFTERSISYDTIIQNTPPDFFNFTPAFKSGTFDSWIEYIVAWMTIGLGSIPQQDVFQRVMSANSEKTAIRSSYFAGIMYLIIGFLPLLIALMFFISDSSLKSLPYDQILLEAILHNTNDVIKTLFFGALISAIMSSASGAVLAPATILGENVIKPLKPDISDKSFLLILRISVVLTVILSSCYAIYSPNVYLLVAESSVISLVSLFVPFIAALYWPKATTLGAFLSLTLGPTAWLIGLYFDLAELSVILGLLTSLLAIYLPSKISRLATST